MKFILLIRHFESTKNTANRFSDTDETGDLTMSAINILEKNQSSINKLLEKFNVKKIYCSDSVRAIKSASLLTENTFNIEILSFKAFNSIKYSPDGSSETEAKNTNPEFINALNFYRKGVLSSYSIPIPQNGEVLSDFEKRVMNCFDSIVGNDESKMCVFFLHRSPITAIVINFLRRYNSYPKDFFGYIKIDLGLCTLLSINNNEGKIEFINENLETIYGVPRIGDLFM